MWGSQWRLAARLLDFPNIIVVADRPLLWPRYSYFDVSDPDQLPVFVADFNKTTAHPHFPYGEVVEAD